jgi:hypothetical protein
VAGLAGAAAASSVFVWFGGDAATPPPRRQHGCALAIWNACRRGWSPALAGLAVGVVFPVHSWRGDDGGRVRGGLPWRGASLALLRTLTAAGVGASPCCRGRPGQGCCARAVRPRLAGTSILPTLLSSLPSHDAAAWAPRSSGSPGSPSPGGGEAEGPLAAAIVERGRRSGSRPPARALLRRVRRPRAGGELLRGAAEARRGGPRPGPQRPGDRRGLPGREAVVASCPWPGGPSARRLRTDPAEPHPRRPRRQLRRPREPRPLEGPLARRAHLRDAQRAPGPDLLLGAAGPEHRTCPQGVAGPVRPGPPDRRGAALRATVGGGGAGDGAPARARPDARGGGRRADARPRSPPPWICSGPGRASCRRPRRWTASTWPSSRP